MDSITFFGRTRCHRVEREDLHCRKNIVSVPRGIPPLVLCRVQPAP